ncbi:MAG: thiamine pyrophosphate-dependent dehydrogenase E1 component subunit alpha [Chloroflexi bacterium]|nr:thiamine pyrophosphate-dependent dehydrogenase E1 component subunit alpha [Chloroflexota bacterium]
MALDNDTLKELYRNMVTVRLLEKRVERLVTAARIPCSGHFGTGQEAVGVGICGPLRSDDYLFGTHRGFAEYIGKGMAPAEILCEYYGKATSLSRGRLGQHLLKVDVGIMPLPSSLGSEFGMSVGAALSSKLRRSGQVTVNLFGEGTAGQADFGPALEMASLWQLPLVFVCNNNQYVELAHYRNVVATEDIAPRAGGYGVPYEIVDGNDITLVYDATERAVSRARNGEGPMLLEFKTYRRGTHYTGDPGGYQPREEIAAWEKKDPIDRCRDRMMAEGFWAETDEQAMRETIEAEIEAAVQFAEESPYPDPATVTENIYAQGGDKS